MVERSNQCRLPAGRTPLDPRRLGPQSPGQGEPAVVTETLEDRMAFVGDPTRIRAETSVRRASAMPPPWW